MKLFTQLAALPLTLAIVLKTGPQVALAIGCRNLQLLDRLGELAPLG